jgi:hypothetical protein
LWVPTALPPTLSRITLPQILPWGPNSWTLIPPRALSVMMLWRMSFSTASPGRSPPIRIPAAALWWMWLNRNVLDGPRDSIAPELPLRGSWPVHVLSICVLVIVLVVDW